MNLKRIFQESVEVCPVVLHADTVAFAGFPIFDPLVEGAPNCMVLLVFRARWYGGDLPPALAQRLQRWAAVRFVASSADAVRLAVEMADDWTRLCTAAGREAKEST